MNLDELMSVWRSQDAAPLHGLNETHLRLALRQDETKRQKWRRIERLIETSEQRGCQPRRSMKGGFCWSNQAEAGAGLEG